MDKWLCLPGKRNESKSSGGIDRSGAASEWMSWVMGRRWKPSREPVSRSDV